MEKKAPVYSIKYRQEVLETLIDINLDEERDKSECTALDAFSANLLPQALGKEVPKFWMLTRSAAISGFTSSMIPIIRSLSEEDLELGILYLSQFGNTKLLEIVQLSRSASIEAELERSINLKSRGDSSSLRK